ncbi:MAG TPA: L-aspartate oxidase [Acidiphilium sp.]
MKYIIGSGLAGLTAALAIAPEPVTLLTEATFDSGSASLRAQGGIAAATGDDDSIALHAADTIAAGDGLCDPATVARIIGAGPDAIRRLGALGVTFDPDPGLEAAHSRRRIAHVRDRTGLAITAAIARAVREAPHVTILERTRAAGLHTVENRVAGLWIERNDTLRFLPADTILIATGGIGALFRHTSNPNGAVGSGLALAARAGAVLRDLEFIQFHPTGLDTGLTPMPLISEAVRGEGARLIDETGARFADELAPRDAVSRAVFRHLTAGHRVFLDATHLGAGFSARFPAIDAACKASGIDPARQPVPVRPVAHYHMGGLAVDAAGRSSVTGLFAAGEASCTGLHGANRLASNSLLEAFCTGEAAGLAMAETTATRACTPPSPPPLLPPTARQGGPAPLRSLIGRTLGILRDGAGLATLIAATAPRADTSDAALIALMLAVAAFDRRESRGGHARTDFPLRSPLARHSDLTMAQALARAAAIAPARHAA